MNLQIQLLPNRGSFPLQEMKTKKKHWVNHLTTATDHSEYFSLLITSILGVP